MREASNGKTVTDTDSYAFSFNNKRQREDDRGFNTYMTVAKGMSNSKAERVIILQGYREQLDVVEYSQQIQEESIKAKLYDIITDYLISDEEKDTLKSPFLKLLDDLEEKHIRIRRSIFIGLYSFWEVSLMNMSDYINADNKISGQKQKKNSTQNKQLGASDYLSIIFGESLPENVKLINKNIRELRNYMVHGSMNPKRKEAIEELITNRSDYQIKASCGEYYFTDYAGLRMILDLFEQELNEIEK